MVASYYLLKLPFTLIWHLCRITGRLLPLVFYCGDYLDYIIARETLAELGKVTLVAADRRTRAELARYGLSSRLWPVFPACVIMARHALHKFPVNNIIKIGLRHGAYHFKEFISAEKYNAFDRFFFTSKQELNQARSLGITSGAVGGFPKLDRAFNGSFSKAYLHDLLSSIGFNDQKPLILFSATWDKSGMSALDSWYNRLRELTSHYQIMVTVHPFTSSRYIRSIRNTPDVHFIEDKDILPYLLLADILISDTSSIIAEFCALNKPIITFRIPEGKRYPSELDQILDAVSIRINSFEELNKVLADITLRGDSKKEIREYYANIMFTELNGRHAEIMAAEIRKFLRSEGSPA
ncbi:MAG: CDP-glycerol glycerophosphotransferase family protein [Candidatus Cloacimonetes bacterium]|nr:CDP-glycerol glycerophosphotransferase family protein [Candidatus Cloacimonadota bacterium]